MPKEWELIYLIILKMADVMTPEQRSRCMAAVKGKDTKPEIIVRKYLFSRGLRFRVQVRKLLGTPDIVLPKYKTVIFVNGCFWHGHEGCKYFRLPKSNVDFWQNKIARNIERDAETEAELMRLGWKVIRIWECEIKAVAGRMDRLEKLYNNIVPNLYSEENTEQGIAAEPEINYGENKL